MGKFFLVQNIGCSYNIYMFRICSICNFEWHSKDGNECPTCANKKDAVTFESSPGEQSARAFGTGTNESRTKAWYSLLGIIALVGIIYTFVLR